MRTIIEITGIEKLTSKLGKKFQRTHAILDDGSIVQGFGGDFMVGDKVESFYDAKWDAHKMRKPNTSVSPPQTHVRGGRG